MYTLTIAVIVMFALPLSQLRTVTVSIECCCPDPTACHCPDHDNGASSSTTMKACHKSAHAFGAPTIPEFTAIAAASACAAARVIAMVDHTHPHPHQPPSLDAPRGPS